MQIIDILVLCKISGRTNKELERAFQRRSVKTIKSQRYKCAGHITPEKIVKKITNPADPNVAKKEGHNRKRQGSEILENRRRGVIHLNKLILTATAYAIIPVA